MIGISEDGADISGAVEEVTSKANLHLPINAGTQILD